MAYFVRKNTAVYIYFHNAESGKNQPLPRSQTKHLDGAADTSVNSWMQNYARTLGYEVANSSAVVGDRWLKLIDKFITTPDVQARAHNTIYAYRMHLTRYVLVYFINVHNLQEPTGWVNKSAGLLAYLINDRKCSVDTASRCNVALRKFWEFLIDEGEVHQSIALRLKNPKLKSRETPLQFTLTPEEVLQMARGLTTFEEKLLILMGYFFSLRPQETFALDRKDFATKEKATSKECSKVMREANLYPGFVVYIERQKVKLKKVGKDGPTWKYDDPKGGIKAFVACFNEDAAKAIVALIKDRTGPLLPQSVDHYNTLWKGVKAKLKVTLKDLRRASIYWLGHHTTLQQTPIKNHARHVKADTTQKYLRRPHETAETDSLDL